MSACWQIIVIASSLISCDHGITPESPALKVSDYITIINSIIANYIISGISYPVQSFVSSVTGGH